MKLLTINCHSWQEENQIDKIKILAETIVSNDYDVVALQEVSQLVKPASDGSIRDDNYVLVLLDEIKKISDNSYDFVWDFAHIGFDIYEEGVGIISKHPIINSRSFYVSKDNSTTYWKSRKVVEATVNYNNQNVNIYSIHLGWWHDKEEFFKDQFDELIKFLDNDTINILMGDFNNCAYLRNQGYDYILECGFKDLAQIDGDNHTIIGEVHGWEGNLVPMRIDHVISNRNLKVVAAKIIFNGVNLPIISDHYGIELEVII